jgi:formamidopyrimidine-DNA glycosylase
MPELPDVERARALLERAALGRRISAVDDCDEWVCRPHRPGEIAGALEGATLVSAHRRGKAMWVETDREAVLGLHLGMAGRIVVDDATEGDPPDGAEARGDGATAAHPRGWDRFTLTFADGGRLALRDKRRLGRVRLDPRRPAGELADDELDRLRRTLRAATRDAIRRGGVHTGEVIPFRRRGAACPRCGAPMERATIGGRTTWWCSHEQRV